MTALFKRLNFVFLIETVTVVVLPRGVATKLMVFWDNSRGGNMPRPLHSILYILQAGRPIVTPIPSKALSNILV